MTLWSARQVGGFWEGAGGPASRVVEWVAIALGESSFYDNAVSSAGAIGLWQIMPFHAGEFGITVDSLYDPRTNALVAVSLSGHGANCAAWDSAYLDIQASGRYTFLGFPERGSADWNNLAAVANELGRHPVIPGPGPQAPGLGADLPGAVARWQDLSGRQLPGLNARLAQVRAAADRAYTKAA